MTKIVDPIFKNLFLDFQMLLKKKNNHVSFTQRLESKYSKKETTLKSRKLMIRNCLLTLWKRRLWMVRYF